MRTVAERFWEKVDASGGPDACWEWRSARFGPGYGHFLKDGKGQAAHRVAYELVHGPIPKGLCVCHSCDNRMCVNPRHLCLGTQADNVADAIIKGRDGNHTHPERHVHGEAVPSSKLTAEQVHDIRTSYAQGVDTKELARRYGVARATVSDAVARRTWRHI